MPDEELNAARWATIAAELDPMAGSPSSTLKPAPSHGGRGEAAVAAFEDELHRDGGRVEVHEVLGRGGMGVVHRGTQTRLRRDVAVKSVPPERATSARRLELLQEAWVTGALEHPNILPVYGIEAGPDAEPWVLLKRLGSTRWIDLMHDADAVRSLLGREDLLQWNLQVFLQICQAVAFAHSKRVIHLDLKPENVMIGEFGEVYLVDWGIAMSLEDDGSGRFRTASKNDQILGTPAFLAPEMLAGDGSKLDERTDVYLLGACLYFLTERRPLRTGDSLMEVLHAAVMEEPAEPSKAAPELAGVIARAISRDPDARHASANELRQAVQSFIDHRDSRARSDEATAVLNGLEHAAGRAKDGTVRSSHAQVQEAFNECRLGFRGALGVWAENPQAKEGLRKAAEIMAWYELARDDLETASAHIAQLSTPSKELLAALEAAQDRKRERLDRAVELEKLDEDRDIAIGQRTRTFVVAVLAGCWAFVPLLIAFIDPTPPGFGVLLGLPIVYLVLLGGFSIWAKESLGRTAINRWLIGSLVIALGGEVAATAGLYVLGLPALTVLPMSFVVWGSVAWMVVLVGERRLWPTAAGITVIGFATALAPAHALWFVSASSMVLLVNTVAIWWPWSESAKRARDRVSPANPKAESLAGGDPAQ